MKKQSVIKTSLSLIQLGVILFILYLSHGYSYPLFHTLVEVFCVAIAGGVFAIGWNSREFSDNNYFLFVGTSLLFVGLIDLLHLMAYKGINVFNFGGNNLPTQLWIMGRLLEGASLVAAPLFINRRVNSRLLFAAYFFLTSALLASLFVYGIFPASYAEGVGLTPFKIYSEYAAIALFAVAIVLLYRRRGKFEKTVLNFLIAGVFLKILAEIMFTLYIDVFSLANFLGHIFKVSSYYLFYLGIIEAALTRPYQTLFKNLKDSEASLKESEHRYRALVEYSPNAIFLHINGVITYINSAGVKLFGARTAEQIIGKKVLDFIDEPHKYFIDSRINNLYRGAKFVPLSEVRVRTLDEKIIDVETIGSLVNLEGKIAGQSVMIDITRRKEIENELARRAEKLENYANNLKKFKLAVENASDNITITDPELKIIYANRAAEKMTGFSEEEMVGQTFLLWLDREKNNGRENKIFDYCRQAGNAGEGKEPNFAQELLNRRKDGSGYISIVNISPVFNKEKKVLFFVIIERDITKIKQIDRAKTEFVSMASHQLRTPLANISLSAELLLRGVAGPVEKNQAQYLGEIYKAAFRMKELISSLLNISRLELGTFAVKLEPIDVEREIDELIKEEETRIKIRGLAFEKNYSAGLPIIKFDKNILGIVVDNLMSNAIRYTPKGGSIKLGVENRRSEILISVSDTGCGIPENQQHKIFGKLFRADNAKEISSVGAGLGLYTAKSVLKRVGGKIWFVSKTGKGTAFFVSIPIK